ncbi:MAG: ATP-dependent DNA helicase RecG [Gammaproteobacteria bacterium]|nr:ATP-dependent DNA helicase RecG [Gammaproteobacteria bacterium]
MKTVTETTDLSLLPCRSLRGVGKSIADRLSHLGIHCVQDLLFHLPLRYQDRTRIYPISHIVPGDHVVIEGTIENVSNPIGGRTRLVCQLRDPTGRIHLRFFYVNASQRQTLQTGVRVRCFGEVRRGSLGLEMIHPEYRIHAEEFIPDVEENLTPIYPTTDGLSQQMFRKLTDQALVMLASGGALQDILPPALLQQYAYPSLKEALHFVHRPPPDAPVDILIEKEHISQKRLVFEELLAHRLSLLHLKRDFQLQKAFPLEKKNYLTTQFLSQLPFDLTKAQSRVLADIQQDLAAPHPMLRLVQGDVGSGKTVVAALAILQAVENGFQCGLLAPTELLTEQHYRTFSQWLTPLDIEVVMLSGQMKTAPRRLALEAIAVGRAKVVIGTHALFQKGVDFNNLALIVVDEQHRFGVQQRALLREKGKFNDHYPHQLIMTATPIPRTLAMSVYADLDYSVIDELPPGRTPVTTTVFSNTRREEILHRVRDACTSGRQAYWVCTLIEESEVLQCQAAENTAAEMREIFPEVQIGLIHGRLKSQEKEEIMAAFKKGELQLLVATTVIEVGVDVPNASLMVIENAERLGLAQLHQLRGRVGRGAVASHCVLMYQTPLSSLAKERLAVMRETTNGFKIAERDLQLRGPGEVLGTRQTGDVSLRIADLLRDDDLLPAVEQAADHLLAHHREAIAPLIKRWLRDSAQYGHV